MRRILLSVFAIALLISFNISFASDPVIDESSLDKGIVTVSMEDSSDTKYRVLIIKDKAKVHYPLSTDGTKVNFPLQYGNGAYQVSVMKNLGGKKYAYVTQKTVNLNLTDSNVVYLNSIQNINWSINDQPIEYVKQLTHNMSDAKSVATAVWGYITGNITYDWEKIPTLKPDYTPNIKSTFADKKGICYDYSSLLASALRSKGYPTRLVKGYSKLVEGYHAWNEVYIDGKWYVVDSTVDASLKPETMFKEASQYTKVYEY